MDTLYLTTTELWPNKAKKILEEKKISIKKLYKKFSKIIFPWSSTYNNYRYFFELQNAELPLFIIVLQNFQEATSALDLLKKYLINLRVNVGRHSTIIINPDFYIDVSELRNITIVKNTLSVNGGATQGLVYKYLFENNKDNINCSSCYMGFGRFHNRYGFLSSSPNALNASPALPGGSAGSVGITGVTTNGGLGSFKRTLGLAIDYVKKFTIALAPNSKCGSRIVNCTKNENEDLFWALKGCVALNFGVMLNIEYEIAYVNQFIAYNLTFDWSNAYNVINLWLISAPTRPNEFNEDLNTYGYNFANEKGVGIDISGQYAIPFGQSIDESLDIIKKNLLPFINISKSFKTRILTYEESVKELGNGRVYYPFSIQRGVFSNLKVDINKVIQHIEKSVGLPGLHLYLFELLGGRIKDKKPTESAFYPREMNYWYDMSSFWTSSLDTCAEKNWLEEAFKFTFIPSNTNNYVFTGLPMNNLPNHLDAYYGKNKSRLLEIKNKYDPELYLKFPSGLVE